ncbi:MAG TPA: MFS transporter [Bacteroidia bacterium]|jgi:predicted MFS family arabinose efflux permease|nr:MFS transporter [Bacteroidia bacterium]
MEKQTQSFTFTSYQKFVILVLALTQFSVILDFMVMSPLGDMLMKSLSLKPAQFGVAVSAYAFSAGISGLLTAGFADRFDRKKLLLFFYIGFILGTVFCSFANTYPLLVAARIITGLFGGVIGSVSMAIVTDVFVIEQRGRTMGFLQMGFGASQVLGIPISLFLANRWGWQSPFLMVAVLSALIVGLIIAKLQPITKHLEMQEKRNAIMHLWATLTKSQYTIGFLATALLSIGGFMMMPFGSAFAINNLKVTQEQLPILFMVSGVCSLIIMPVIGRLSDKTDKFKIFAFASIWMMVMVVLYTNLSVTPLWLVIIFNVLLMMGIMSRIVPSSALVSNIPEMKDRGAFMSINSSLQQIAGGIAAAFAGTVVTQKDKFSPIEHYNTLGYIIIGISVLGILSLYRVSAMTKKRAEKK